MKILHVISNLSGGGAERQFSYLISGLLEKGHEVHVAYLYNGDFPLHQFDSVHFHCISATGNYDPRIMYHLVKLTRSIQPDLIQSWILQADVLSALVTMITKVKWVMREPNAPDLRRKRDIKFIVRAKLARSSSAIIANSNAGVNYWRRLYKGKQLFMIRNGFPIDKIALPRNEEATCSYNGARNILFVGRLEYQKNIGALLSAMCHIPSDIKLILCGKGSYQSYCRDMIVDLGLVNRVDIIGNVSSDVVYKLMRHSNALILVSHYEGFPNVLVEGMLNKCPLVVSSIEPHREFLDETTATFVNKDDPFDIAQSIMHVLNDEQSTQKRVNKAFNVAHQFSIERMVESYCNIYDHLLQED